jgi:hypothetical protein
MRRTRDRANPSRLALPSQDTESPMQQNLKEIAHEAGVHHPLNDTSGRDVPLPNPQSGKNVLLNIFFYMILLPGVIMLLAQLLIE